MVVGIPGSLYMRLIQVILGLPGPPGTPPPTPVGLYWLEWIWWNTVVVWYIISISKKACITLPKVNIAPKKIASLYRKVVFNHHFPGATLNFGGVCHYDTFDLLNGYLYFGNCNYQNILTIVHCLLYWLARGSYSN